VDGMKYAKDVVRAVYRYKQTCRSVSRYPEFEEYFVHYPVKQSKYSSHYYTRQMAGSGNRILDVGCGEGILAAELKENGNQVSGTDFLQHPQHEADLAHYMPLDLDGGIGPLVEALRGQKFDRILLLDVLEHLKDSGQILRECPALLEERGHVIVSVPNVANITVRLMLLFGSFNYTERGILDRTHLRLFTRRTTRELLEKNGYRILDEKLTVMPLELIFGLSPENFLMKLINRTLAILTKLMPGLFGYQIMLVAEPRQH